MSDTDTFDEEPFFIVDKTEEHERAVQARLGDAVIAQLEQAIAEAHSDPWRLHKLQVMVSDVQSVVSIATLTDGKTFVYDGLFLPPPDAPEQIVSVTPLPLQGNIPEADIVHIPMSLTGYYLMCETYNQTNRYVQMCDGQQSWHSYRCKQGTLVYTPLVYGFTQVIGDYRNIFELKTYAFRVETDTYTALIDGQERTFTQGQVIVPMSIL